MQDTPVIPEPPPSAAKVPPRDRRRENAAQTQRALLQAAQRQFGALGFEATSIARICEEAQVTTGAAYHHFGDKKGLFSALAHEIDATLARTAKAAGIAALEAGQSPWDVFLVTLDVVLEAGLNLELRRIMLTEAPAVLGAQAWDDLRRAHGLGALLETLRALQVHGIFTHHDLESAARIILGTLYGAVETLPEEPIAAQRALRNAKRWVHAMLAALRDAPDI
jgi:AcrR family transcriptional regulator